MKKTITPELLKQWCTDRRGRGAAIAELLGTSREFVRQLSLGIRPIPHDIGKLLAPAMRAVEVHERKTFALARKRVREGVT